MREGAGYRPLVADAGIVIRWVRDPDDLRDALRVREEVFCDEQGVPRSEERDGLDDEALHLVAIDGASDRVVGTLRVLVSGDSAKIGRVAVDRRWRRRGIAARMLEMAIEAAREHRCTRARLAAQLDALSLYEQGGFAVESGPFEEAGILHVWMGRSLAA